MTLTVKPSSSAAGASAIAAPRADAAMMLWPHACPIPGRLSYSAQITMWSGPRPAWAAKAVGNSQIPRSTLKPLSASSCASQALALTSW